jgi:hypothetical protein
MIQYSEASVNSLDVAAYWMPAGACHPAGRRPDRLAGMTA